MFFFPLFLDLEIIFWFIEERLAGYTGKSFSSLCHLVLGILIHHSSTRSNTLSEKKVTSCGTRHCASELYHIRARKGPGAPFYRQGSGGTADREHSLKAGKQQSCNRAQAHQTKPVIFSECICTQKIAVTFLMTVILTYLKYSIGLNLNFHLMERSYISSLKKIQRDSLM